MMDSIGDNIPTELLPYKHRLSPRFFELRASLLDFVLTVVAPRRAEYNALREAGEGDPLKQPQPALVKELQAEAKKRGLWNLFLPEVSGVSNLEYAPLAEVITAQELKHGRGSSLFVY